MGPLTGICKRSAGRDFHRIKWSDAGNAAIGSLQTKRFGGVNALPAFAQRTSRYDEIREVLRIIRLRRIAVVNGNSAAIHSTRIKFSPCNRNVFCIGIDGNDLQLSLFRQFVCQRPVATTKIDAETCGSTRTLNDFRCGVGKDRIVAVGVIVQFRTMHNLSLIHI